MLAAAAQSPDAEVCGLLFGNGDGIDAAQPCRNVADDPARAFEVDPAMLIAAHRSARCGGPQIVGHYHSHPTGSTRPSARDAACAGDGELWLIIGGHDISLWRATTRGAWMDRFDPVAIDVT